MQQHHPRVVAVRSRLRDERGFSLLELQVAELLGGFVIATALMMMIVAVNASDRVTDRVNAAQVGRISMEQVQQRVRSQTCLFPGEYAVNGSTLAAGAQASIIHAGDQKIVFIGDLSATGGATNVTGSVGFRPQMRYIYLVTDSTGRRGRLVEGWRNATTTTAPYNFNISPSVNFNALANAAAMNGVRAVDAARDGRRHHQHGWRIGGGRGDRSDRAAVPLLRRGRSPDRHQRLDRRRSDQPVGCHHASDGRLQGGRRIGQGQGRRRAFELGQSHCFIPQ